jgi:hypothetical protein
MYILTIDSLLPTDWQRTDPPSRQRGRPPQDNTETVKQQQISGHEPQPGLDTKTDWLTDRQSKCDSDLDSDLDVGTSLAYDTSKQTLLYWRHNPAPLETAVISIVITHQSLPPTRPVHRCSAGQQEESQLVAAQPAPHDTARCSAGQEEEGQPTATPTPLLRANGSTASQLTRGKLHLASSRHARLPSANRYALRPFSGPTNSAASQPTLRELRLASLIVCDSNCEYLL